MRQARGFGWQRKSRYCLIDIAIGTVFREQVCEAIMGNLRTALLSSLLTTGFALCGYAQDARPEQTPPRAATGSPMSLTGKERLGRKWMDEQRIDNCNVPADKRGTKLRPSICPHIPTG